MLATELEGILTFLLAIEEREPKPRPRLPRVLSRLLRRQAPQEASCAEAESNTSIPSIDVNEKPSYLSPSSSMPYSSSSWSHDPKKIVSQTVEITSIYSGPPSLASCLTINSGIDKETNKRSNLKLVSWLLAPVTVYAFRFGLLSIGVFVFAVNRTTVEFFNVNSGVLALVLAQACSNSFFQRGSLTYFTQSYLTVYAGDQVVA